MLRKFGNFVLLHALRALMITAITVNSLFNRVRMSHENGIVGRGKIRIVDNPELPANGFFRPGAIFPCRIRHASVSFMDDAAMVVRGASLKFADADDASPLDILMNNGAGSPFWNMWTFAQFMWARMRGGRANLIPYFRRNPRCFLNVAEALRLDPSSFAQLYYYSETPLRFVADDAVERYIKFRLIPGNRGPESGIPASENLQQPWFQEAKPAETRSPNYLKNEYRERVTNEAITYHLQAQLHEWQPGDSRDVVLNSLYPWDEASRPWRDIAEVTIQAALAHEDGDNCLFGLNHLPHCIQRITPTTIHDPPSLEFLRAAGTWPRKARLLSYRIFGRNLPISDTRISQSHPDEAAVEITSRDIYPVVCLPQNDDATGLAARNQQLEQSRGRYQWVHAAGIPPFLRDLPQEEAFSKSISDRMGLDIAVTVISLLLSKLERRLTEARGLRAYDLLYTLRRHLPACAEHVRSDVEFARQRVAGINPIVIRRCEALPSNFPVTDHDVSGLLDPGDTLASACAGGRVYLCDYAALIGIPTVTGRYACIPMGLFYCGSSKTLMPLAIQLSQDPANGPIFTPNDDRELWQLVKTWFRCADAQLHEADTHLLRTHLVVEVFTIAMHRQLSPAHPVHQLLLPHLQFTLAINTAARKEMLAPGGPIDSTMAIGRDGALALMAKTWSGSWSFTDYDLAADFAARGVADPEQLPHYPYRDDALRVWSAIASFVDAVLRHFYASDADVAQDPELAAWYQELQSAEGGCVRGLPGAPGQTAFETFAQLHTVVSRLIFIASAGHAAVNNGQYDQFGYIPCTPGAMWLPPPTSKAACTESDIINALPRFKPSGKQIGMVHLLSLRPEVTLGSYDPSFFAGNKAIGPRIERFQQQLAAISGDIRERNASLQVPYTYLDPVQIARSINA